mgnify:CR=1 FL=1
MHKKRTSVRQNKYGTVPKPAVPKIDPVSKKKSAGRSRSIPGGPVPNKSGWFKGKRISKPQIDTRNFQRHPNSIPRRLVGRALSQELETQERAYQRTVAGSNNFDSKSFDFVASLGTPDFTRVVLHQTAPDQKVVHQTTRGLQDTLQAIEQRVASAENFVGLEPDRSSLQNERHESFGSSRGDRAHSAYSRSSDDHRHGARNRFGIEGGFGAGAAGVPGPSRRSKRKMATKLQEELEVGSDDDEDEINTWMRAYRKEYKFDTSIKTIQTWYRMVIPCVKLKLWKRRRTAYRRIHFEAYKRLYLSVKMNRIIQCRAFFLKWRDYSFRKKYKGQQEQEVFDAVAESKTAAGNMALLLGINSNMAEMQGSAKARQEAAERRTLSMYQLRVQLVRKYWRFWRIFSIRKHKLRIKFATHIRNANKLLPSAEQGSQIWIGEWLGIIVQMWHRYTVFKRHVRANKPGMPDFGKPWGMWTKWLRAHEARKLREYRSTVMGSFSFVRRFLWRWKAFCRDKSTMRVNEARARQFHCRLVLRHWSNYVRSQGKDRRFMRRVMREWRRVAGQQQLFRAIHKKLTQKRERRIKKVHLAALRFTVSELRIMRAHGRHKLLAPRGCVLCTRLSAASRFFFNMSCHC